MKEENDSITPIEQFKRRIIEKGVLHQSLLEYLGISAGDAGDASKTNKIEGKTENLYQILKSNNFSKNKCEFREFLKTISHLWEMHQSMKGIKCHIESLLRTLKEDMKNIFSEKEIFSVFQFCGNKNIFLILVDENIISIETIIKNINLMGCHKDGWNMIKYFYPEIRKYDDKHLSQLMTKDKIFGLKNFVEENDQNLEFYYKIRKEGEKEAKIVELIRADQIDEFISFIEHYPTDLNKTIPKEETKFGTIFGTVTKELTPIEYSALFGSVAIFKYLYLKNVDNIIISEDYNSKIIEFAVQGRNYEIIHLLEERKEIIEELNKNQLKYLEVTIKMHYNEIFEYLITNLNILVTEEIIKLVIKYRNYHLFKQIIELNQIEIKGKEIVTNIFHEICKNENVEIVRILMNQPNLDINSKDEILDYFLELIKKNKETIDASRKNSLLLIKFEIEKNILLQN